MQKIALVFLLLTITACSEFPWVYKIDIEQGNIIEQEAVDQLIPGLTKNQVRFILGSPINIDTFNQQRWDYVYSMSRGGGGHRQERLSLYFVDDRLEYFQGDFIPSGAMDDEPATEEETTVEQTTEVQTAEEAIIEEQTTEVQAVEEEIIEEQTTEVQAAEEAIIEEQTTEVQAVEEEIIEEQVEAEAEAEAIIQSVDDATAEDMEEIEDGILQIRIQDDEGTEQRVK
jgi:outer membrane protein assembly factor BamE